MQCEKCGAELNYKVTGTETIFYCLNIKCRHSVSLRLGSSLTSDFRYMITLLWMETKKLRYLEKESSANFTRNIEVLSKLNKLINDPPLWGKKWLREVTKIKDKLIKEVLKE